MRGSGGTLGHFPLYKGGPQLSAVSPQRLVCSGTMMKLRMVLFPALLIVGSAAVAQDARGADVEGAVVAYVDAHQSEANALLERIVNINSGTHNLEGVQAVARIMEDELKALGFQVEFKPMD